ncbi:MAG: hypothetical protein E7256_02890 [Lachnospiraceae bacterium]|nr:hypothetical protein [Lachnospiraceae bacterium]
MKDRIIFYGSLIIMIAAVLLMALNVFLVPFSDWAVRVLGIVMLLTIVILSYSSVRLTRTKK